MVCGNSFRVLECLIPEIGIGGVDADAGFQKAS